MLLIGGYTKHDDAHSPQGKARGISAYDFFPTDGRIQFLGYAPATNPSFLLTDRKRSVVYAVSELSSAAGACITAHKIQRNKRGTVTFERLSEVPIPGDHPCHLSFAGNTILVANYHSGHLHVIERKEDGSLGNLLQTVELSSQEGRQAHAHGTVYVKSKNWVLLTDLGDDKLKVFDRAADGVLTHLPEADLAFPAGEGPRHIALHPEENLAVVNGEMRGRVHLIDLSGEQPLRANVANALPERVLEEAQGAAIRLSTNGKMVYCSDRAFSVVTVLRIDERSKKLVVRDTYPSGGESPRDLSLAPKGEWLLTANTQDSTVGVFRVDPRGGLAHYHTFRKVPSPTCLAWL